MKPEKLPSGNYRIRPVIDGKRYTITFDHKPGKAEIERAIYQKHNELPAENIKGTFKYYAKKYIDLKTPVLSPPTIKEYARLNNRVVPDSFHRMQLYDIRSEDVQLIINEYSANHSAKSVQNYNGFIMSVINYFKPSNNINVVLPKEAPKDVYMPSDSDVQAIIEAARGTLYENVIILAAYGLRRSEICALTMDDIGDSVIHINKAMVIDVNNNWVIRHMTKTDTSTRDVPVDQEVTDRIKALGCVYSGSPHSIDQWLYANTERLNIEHFSLHKLRHYFASASHTIGVPDVYIMFLGGWKTDHVMKRIYRKAQKEITAQQAIKFINHIKNGHNMVTTSQNH